MKKLAMMARFLRSLPSFGLGLGLLAIGLELTLAVITVWARRQGIFVPDKAVNYLLGTAFFSAVLGLAAGGLSGQRTGRRGRVRLLAVWASGIGLFLFFMMPALLPG